MANQMPKTEPKSRPFSKEHQLNHELDSPQKEKLSALLPGQPSIGLDDPVGLADFLAREFCAPDLEKMAPHLWLMSTQSSTNVSPLHHQKVKGRDIIVTEDPRLHLVWAYDRIFIKPIPKYLLSRAFWDFYLSNDSSPLDARRESIQAAALGYLRTYFYLIRHESDFYIAQHEQLRLIPQHVKWTEFCRFTSNFPSIEDSEVSDRYSYGEIRLTRLNFFARIFLRQFHFQRIHHQYGAFFSRFYGPLLFVFGIISIILSALQVEIALEQGILGSWLAFWHMSRWFCVAVLLGILILSLALMSLLVYMVFNELVFAIRARLRKRSRVYEDMHQN